MLYFYFYHPHDYLLLGLKFYSRDGAVILQAGADWIAWGYNTHTVQLADGERVIGYKSRVDAHYDCHYDFQLIIGRLV